MPDDAAFGDVCAGAESGGSRRPGSAERALVHPLPGRGAGLGAGGGHVQGRSLPVLCEHVCLHLPDLPHERGPLAGCHSALPLPATAYQTGSLEPSAGALEPGLPAGTAHGLLPQVCVCVCVCVRVCVSLSGLPAGTAHGLLPQVCVCVCVCESVCESLWSLLLGLWSLAFLLALPMAIYRRCV